MAVTYFSFQLVDCFHPFLSSLAAAKRWQAEEVRIEEVKLVRKQVLSL